MFLIREMSMVPSVCVLLGENKLWKNWIISDFKLLCQIQWLINPLEAKEENVASLIGEMSGRFIKQFILKKKNNIISMLFVVVKGSIVGF